MAGGGSGGETQAVEETGTPSDDLTHGFVELQFARSESLPDWPFSTAEISVTMEYDPCFTEFYDANPNYEADGVDGAPIFGTLADGGEGWRDRLCAPADPGQVACTVSEIEQQLDVASLLTVTYAVTSDVENQQLKFGPLPLIDEIPEFVCESGSPRVLVSPQQIQGRDAVGNVIWEGEALDEDMAAPGQGKAVVVKVAPAQ
jgi:hypothetical protein